MNYFSAGLEFSMMGKFAWSGEGHTLLTGNVSKAMNAGPEAGRVLGEYASTIADATGSGKTGRMAMKANELSAAGGMANKVKAKALNFGAGLGAALDAPIMHPFSAIATSRHALPGTLEASAEKIKSGRASAGEMLARAAVEPSAAKQERLFVRGLGLAGESAHIAQDVKPHTVDAGRFADEAAQGLHSKKLKAASWLSDKVAPKRLDSLAKGAIGHAASGLEGMDAGLDQVKNISQRDMRNASKHGRKVRIAAIENLRYQHNIPTQQAVNMIDDLMKTSPGALNEIAGKAGHRGSSYKEVGKKLLGLIGKLR